MNLPIQRVGPAKSLVSRMVRYLATPGGGLKAVGVGVAVIALVSPLFWQASVHDVASGLGAAVMVWWLGFKVREKAERDGEE